MYSSSVNRNLGLWCARHLSLGFLPQRPATIWAHDVPAWAGGSAQQKLADNPFRTAAPDGTNPFAAVAQQPIPLWVPARPEGTDNPFATSSASDALADNPFTTTVPTSKQAAADPAHPAKRPSPPPSRPWKGCCGVSPWQGCICCVCIGLTCSFVGGVAYRLGYWEAFGIIYSLDAVASIGAMVPPHRRTATPPHCRTAAPPHRRTAAPLHPLHLLRATRSSSPVRASTAAASLHVPTGRSGQSSASPTGGSSC